MENQSVFWVYVLLHVGDGIAEMETSRFEISWSKEWRREDTTAVAVFCSASLGLSNIVEEAKSLSCAPTRNQYSMTAVVSCNKRANRLHQRSHTRLAFCCSLAKAKFGVLISEAPVAGLLVVAGDEGW